MIFKHTGGIAKDTKLKENEVPIILTPMEEDMDTNEESEGHEEGMDVLRSGAFASELSIPVVATEQEKYEGGETGAHANYSNEFLGRETKQKWFFVWVKGMAGPQPQIWSESQVTDVSGKPTPRLFIHEFTDDELDRGITLAGMAQLYPAPVDPLAAPAHKLVLPVQVTLISYTGHGNPDPMYAARLLAYTKNTRLEQGHTTREVMKLLTKEELDKELDYISKTIRSSWEFVTFTFEIKNVTRAFTHQFVRTRVGISFAQQAQRVVDMKDFNTTVPDTVKNNEMAYNIWNHVNNVIAQGYQQMQGLGIPNQDCRGLLPTNVHTNIIAKVNLRTLADLLGKRKNLRAQGEYAQVARLMERVVLEVMPWTKPFLDPERLKTPELDALLKKAVGTGSPVDQPRVNAALKELDALKGTWG